MATAQGILDREFPVSTFFGPSRVADVTLGNGLICTWMNNARTNSAVQASVANPGWGSISSDRLGYDGSGRAFTKRYLAGGVGSGGDNNTVALLGFTTEFDRASNKFYERALHAANRSHMYEPFSLVSGSYVPQGGYDSADRLMQYQRGTLDATIGFNGLGGGAVDSPINLNNADSLRSYSFDGLGNWQNTGFTPVGGALPRR